MSSHYLKSYLMTKKNPSLLKHMRTGFTNICNCKIKSIVSILMTWKRLVVEVGSLIEENMLSRVSLNLIPCLRII